MEYPRTWGWGEPGYAAIKVLDMRLGLNLPVGYVDGVNGATRPSRSSTCGSVGIFRSARWRAVSPVCGAMEQLGAQLEHIGGGRSEVRQAVALRRRGYRSGPTSGTWCFARTTTGCWSTSRRAAPLVVQYKKFEFNDAQYGPYAALVGRGRVTDELVAVRILEPDHPVFEHPNAISDATWSGGVQERGLYLRGDRDRAYTDLVELSDPFPSNPGAKRGALVEARYGEGRRVYVGLGLWRQLPAGTPGAYRLLANLLSLGGD